MKTRTETFVVDTSARTRGLYSPFVQALIRKLNPNKYIERYSHIEYDNMRQQWVATLAATGEEIAVGDSKEEVEELERLHYERNA